MLPNRHTHTAHRHAEPRRSFRGSLVRLHVPQPVIQVVDVFDADPFVDSADVLRRQPHDPDTQSVLLPFRHDRDDGVRGRGAEPGSRGSQPRTHNVCSAEYKLDGSFINLLVWQDERIFVK